MAHLPKAKERLTGLEKTAILMNVLGEERSYELMKDLKDTDVRRLLNVMGQLKKAPIRLINEVLKEFLFKLSETEEILFTDDLTEMEKVKRGLGEDRAKQIFGTVKNVNLVNRKHLKVLEHVEPKTLAEFLVAEHPQTIAIILAHMELDKQIVMIKMFPDAIRAEVILRMANLEYVDPEKVDELDSVLKHELVDHGKSKDNKFGGVVAMADLINSLDKRLMNSILARLEDKDPLLTEEIRQHMFTFSDIIKIDDRGIQLVLREVSNDKLLLALKSAPQEVKDKIFGSMSQRASEMLSEDLQALGPQKVSDVEAAQREVVTVVKRLEEEGKIVIGIGEDQEIIP
ncbi:MAG: flagellar motor switch protein FliG [Bdellovibrionaceae bacterium]|nr:flagellar motor switch protein FliG [Pseudobdellovibrionaceae bacterium]